MSTVSIINGESTLFTINYNIEHIEKDGRSFGSPVELVLHVSSEHPEIVSQWVTRTGTGDSESININIGDSSYEFLFNDVHADYRDASRDVVLLIDTLNYVKQLIIEGE